MELGRRRDLGEEALRAHDRGHLRLQHLERDFASVLDVVGQIHRGHAALAELPLDAVAAAEGGVQAFARRGHDGRKMRRTSGPVQQPRNAAT
jgi:hypothetical protein